MNRTNGGKQSFKLVSTENDCKYKWNVSIIYLTIFGLEWNVFPVAHLVYSFFILYVHNLVRTT